MVNYLWPALTILSAVLFTGTRAKWWLVPGLVLCWGAVFWIISNGEFSFTDFISRSMENPRSYLLGLGAALLWTIYSTVTVLWGKGQNFSALILLADSLFFALLWLIGFGETPPVTEKGILSLFVGGLAIGIAYGCWTHGTLYGNVSVLAVASYFTSVLSCAFGTVWLDVDLPGSFWLGSAFLVFGSLLCWRSIQRT